MNRAYHSVRLEKERCMGCTTCLKRCPTEAIRVRDGRAHIIDELCIDCGECIRVCPHHAKVALTDPFDSIRRFPYRIALPAPSLYGQFKSLGSINRALTGLRRLGFDAVFEVARGADVVSRALIERLKRPDVPKPLISAACPAIVRLIQARFPDLIDHVVDIRQPMEVAALMARQEFCQEHGVAPEEVGCFFITPCPAKMTAIRSPIGHEKSALDGAISIMEIYGRLAAQLRKGGEEEPIAGATPYGVGWANSGGEAAAIHSENSMAVDGIENVIRVLEEIENNRLNDLDFFEGQACTGGCVGGPLTFENGYVAKNTIRKLTERMEHTRPETAVDVSALNKYPIYNTLPIQPSYGMRLGDNIVEAMRKMERIEQIAKELPGYDCGSCGSPTCRTLAEDIAHRYAGEMDSIYRLKSRLQVMAQQMVELSERTRK